MPRILVVDDETLARTAITIALEANGFDVVAVESGKSGLSAYDESQFDLAIVDFFMWDMDGLEVIKALRKRNPKLPIIAMSGGTDGLAVLDILPTAAEMSGIICLHKPFRPNELIQAIQEAHHAVARPC